MQRMMWLIVAVLCAVSGMAQAQDHITFPSQGTTIDGYLFRTPAPGPHPALVFLHGCGGLFNRRGGIESRELDWAARFTAAGTSVLMVDSFSARGYRSMCAPADFRAAVFDARPGDATAALRYLQAQNFVQPDHVSLMGWSEGGGAVLFTLRDPGTGRPAGLAQDFRAAVAFYPARCNAVRFDPPWTSHIPLLVLQGASDVWTPAPPCQAMIEDAARRGVPAEIHVYPDAYHDFDWPHLKLHQVPAYMTRQGVVPIEGTNEAARADAIARAMAFLAK